MDTRAEQIKDNQKIYLAVPIDPMSDLYPEWKGVPISGDEPASLIGNK